MGVTNYTPSGISHRTSVDFSKRTVGQPVHIVQYDDTLPILAVSLYNNGQPYRIPESSEVRIRFGKPDKTFVYKSALGCDINRTIVYFEISQQMTVINGDYYPVIELKDNGRIANSSAIFVAIDRNPIQNGDIESPYENKDLSKYRDEAVKAAEEAKNSANIATEMAEKAKGAENFYKLAKSYAVGTDNEIRSNDKTDNAKWYYENVKEDAERLDGAVDMLKKLTVSFEIDFDTGELIQEDNSRYRFSINEETGNLEMEVEE